MSCRVQYDVSESRRFSRRRLGHIIATLKGDELKALQERLKGPLARMTAVFESVDKGNLDDLTNAMRTAGKDVNDALGGK